MPRKYFAAPAAHRTGRFLGVGLAALLLAASTCVQAQDNKANREREALRRTQQALRQAQEESATLARDKATLGNEKAELTRQNAQLETDLKKSAGQAAQARSAQSRAQQLDHELATLRTEHTALQARATEQAAKLQEAQGTLAAVRTLLERATQRQALLERRNQELYDTGLAAIELYRSKDAAATWAQREPLLGFKQVGIENAAEAMRGKLEMARSDQPR